MKDPQRTALIRCIFAQARKLHHEEVATSDDLKEEIHHDLLNWQISTIPSIRRLSIRQLRELADQYSSLIGDSSQRPWRQRTRSRRTNTYSPITDPQQALLVKLFDELGMDPMGRANFCAHVLFGYLANRGEPSIRLIWPQNRGQAGAVINGLLSITHRRKRSENFTHPRVSP